MTEGEPQSTLDCGETDRQTDRGPAGYVSLRVTIPHCQWEVVEQCLEGFDWYISYPHKGKNGTNEHFHVALPGTNKEAKRVRERLKGAGLSGNKQLSLKCLENGVESFIQYASREKTTPKTRGSVSEWIDNAPKWLNANLRENMNPITGKRKADTMMDDMRPINAKNVLYSAWAYRRDFLVTDPKSDKYDSIGDVILHMLDSGKYYFDPAFARQGVPDFYIDIFKSSCQVGRLTYAKDQKNWMGVIFRPISSRW
jgi:hypothetical protein